MKNFLLILLIWPLTVLVQVITWSGVLVSSISLFLVSGVNGPLLRFLGYLNRL